MSERHGPVEERLLVGPRAQLYWFGWGVLTMGVNVIELTTGTPGAALLTALMLVLWLAWAVAGAAVGWLPGGATGHRRR